MGPVVCLSINRRSQEEFPRVSILNMIKDKFLVIIAVSNFHKISTLCAWLNRMLSIRTPKKSSASDGYVDGSVVVKLGDTNHAQRNTNL